MRGLKYSPKLSTSGDALARGNPNSPQEKLKDISYKQEKEYEQRLYEARKSAYAKGIVNLYKDPSILDPFA
jgi:hypothetical protein